METKKASLLNANLRWFLFAMILANIASEMVFVLLPVYLSTLGASVAQIGLVFSVASLVPLALQIFGGWLSDSIGRLRTIALGSLGGSLGYFGLLLAPSWQWVLLALCLEYISGSLVGPSFGAFIAEQSSEENRGRVFGLSKGIFMIVRVVGPLLGGFLADRYGFKVMLLAAFVMYASATALRVWMANTVRFVGETAPERPTWLSFRTGMRDMVGMLTMGGVLTWILITDGVGDVAFRLSGELQPLYLSKIGSMSIEQIGQLSSILGIASILFTLPAGWLSDKYGERVAIAGGFLLEFLALMVFLQANGFLGFAVAMFIFGAGVGMMNPSYDSLVSKAVPERLRGIAFGFFNTSLGVISLPAPWLGAQLWEHSSPRLPFAITAAAALISVAPVWFKFVLPDTGAKAGEADVVETPGDSRTAPEK